MTVQTREELLAQLIPLISENGFTPFEDVRNYYKASDAVDKALTEDEALGSDKEFMLRAVAFNGSLLKHAHPSLRSDRGLVLAAVQHSATGSSRPATYRRPALP